MKQPAPIEAELFGSNECRALGITAKSDSPFLLLCRQLVDTGHDPATPLEAYRRGKLALRVKSIGQGARLKIGTSGSGTPIFAPASGADIAPPMRHFREAAE